MYKRAGISMKSLGYGRTLRPYLDVNHENGTTVEIDSEDSAALGISPDYSGDEWTYSRAAVATPIENPGSLTADIHSADLTDTYSFTILGDSVAESTTDDYPDESTGVTQTDSFVSVGMVSEWLDSFKRKNLTSSDTIGIDPDNALLQLRSQQGADKEEVLELAKSNADEGRPWDLAGAQFTTAVQVGYCQSTGSESSYVVFRAPCGLFNLSLENTHTAEKLNVEFEVLDISDM